MIKKYFVMVALLAQLVPHVAAAQETATDDAAADAAAETEAAAAEEATGEEVGEQAETARLKAAIRAQEAVEVGRPIIFDGSQTANPNEESLDFEWDFGDGGSGTGEELVRTYDQTGSYTVTLRAIGETETSETSVELFVYQKLLVLVTDDTSLQERIRGLRDFAKEQNTFIKLIAAFDSPSDFVAEEILTNKLAEQRSDLEKTKEIIIWTKGNVGLNALSRLRQKNRDLDLSNKHILVIFEGGFRGIGNIQRQFFIVKPKRIILLHEAAAFPLLTLEPGETISDKLEQGGHEYRMVDESTGALRVWNFMSYIVNFLVGQGIPDNTIVLLLLLPVIATVVAFMKQVIGVTTLGIYTPSIVTLTFLALGVKLGLLALVVILVIGTISRMVLRRYRLLFIPKVAIVLTIVALSLFFLLTTSASLKLFDVQFLALAIFPMLILATLIEKFVVVQAEKGFVPTILLTLETIGVSIVAFFIVGGEIPLGFTALKFNAVRDLFLNYPELIFGVIVVNILLGRWTGLRLFEYIRFREVIQHSEE